MRLLGLDQTELTELKWGALMLSND